MPPTSNFWRLSKNGAIGRTALVLTLFVAVLATLACTCGNLLDPTQLVRAVAPAEIVEDLEAFETVQAPGNGAVDGAALPDLLESGSLELESIGTTEAGETQGPILSLQLVNPTSGELIVEIPCGLIFQPKESGDQRMMTIQLASAMVPAGGSVQLSPYVVCIDPESAAPSSASTYEVGLMAQSDLLKLAECICDEPLEDNLSAEAGFETIGIQLAVWAVSSGQPLDDIISGGFGDDSAAGGVMGEEMGGLFEGMMEMVLAPARQVLERCQVTIAPQ